MTQDKELLELARLVSEQMETPEQQQRGQLAEPGNTAILHKPLDMGDTQLIGYRPRTRPGAKTKFWMFARFTFFALVGLCLAGFLWSYIDSKRATPAAADAQPAANPVAPASSGQYGAAQPAATGGGGASVFTAGPQTGSTASYANRLRPQGVLESLGAQPSGLLSIDKVRMPLDGKPLRATAVLYALLDERTEQRWRDAKILAPTPSPSPFLKPVTIASESALDLLRDWHVEGVVVGKK